MMYSNLDKKDLVSLTFGYFFFRKYKDQQKLSGTEYTARQMRKRGIPLELALSVLTHK